MTYEIDSFSTTAPLSLSRIWRLFFGKHKQIYTFSHETDWPKMYLEGGTKWIHKWTQVSYNVQAITNWKRTHEYLNATQGPHSPSMYYSNSCNNIV